MTMIQKDFLPITKADLKKRGMKFTGSTVIYSFLQAIGVVNSHTKNCFLYNIKKEL